MSQDKTSIRELVWLTRLRQEPLPGVEMTPERLLWLRAECEDQDCLPWYHKRLECRRTDEGPGQEARADKTTPVT